MAVLKTLEEGNRFGVIVPGGILGTKGDAVIFYKGTDQSMIPVDIYESNGSLKLVRSCEIPNPDYSKSPQVQRS